MSEHGDPTPYELERAVVTPDLPGEVVVRETHFDACEALAADLLVHAHNCVRAFGDFHLCLTGDGAVEPVLLRLLTDPAHRDLPWRRTHLWLFGERLGGGGGREYDLIHETVALHADLPGEQAHAIDASGGDAAVASQERAIRETLAWREKGHDRFDCVLLTPGSAPAGWGGDAEDDGALVRVFGDRVACTRRLVNASRLIAVYAAGGGARSAIGDAVAGAHPLSALSPVGGVLRWYLDEAACPA